MSYGLDNPMSYGVPVIEIAYPKNMWWSLPRETSAAILEETKTNTIVAFVWDWGNESQGTFRPEGKATGQSRYVLNFSTHTQTNLDTKFVRSFRVAMVKEEHVE